ncbi:MAG TPA: hypothetical protein VE326_02945, partial [Candidatus Binatia bacterium]|nr:hypothetical protein [Candidatus Binatia bacterium]
MRNYTLTHLNDAALLRGLTVQATRDRELTAMLLAYIAEVDFRRAYVPEGCASMFAYCVDRLRFSEDSASKRIHAARAARRVPALFDALAEGRMHLSAVWLLAPHITPENADELIEAATHRRKSEIESYLARRFPAFRPPVAAAVIRPVGTGIGRPGFADASLFDGHAPGHVDLGLGVHAPRHVDVDHDRGEHAPGHVDRDHDRGEHAPGHIDQDHDRSEHAPGHVDAERYLVRVTIDRSTHDKLRHAQALLSHAVPSGDVAQVLDRALDALIARLEKRKLGAGRTTSDAAGEVRTVLVRPRRTRHAGTRHIPTQVRRAVWERDGGRCTFVSADGYRCASRRFLEFDHIEPFARGGMSHVDGLRLRCRAHNQHAAEQTFGA